MYPRIRLYAPQKAKGTDLSFFQFAGNYCPRSLANLTVSGSIDGPEELEAGKKDWEEACMI